jgi:ribosomal protein L31E
MYTNFVDTFFSEAVAILRCMIKMHTGLHPCQILIKSELSGHIFEKNIQMQNFMKIRPLEA